MSDINPVIEVVFRITIVDEEPVVSNVIDMVDVDFEIVNIVRSRSLMRGHNSRQGGRVWSVFAKARWMFKRRCC